MKPKYRKNVERQEPALKLLKCLQGPPRTKQGRCLAPGQALDPGYPSTSEPSRKGVIKSMLQIQETEVEGNAAGTARAGSEP